MKRKLQDNFKRVEQRVADACARFGRERSDVKLITVTKYTTLEVVRTLIDLGVTSLGENKVQDLTQRAAMVREWMGRRTLEGAGAKPGDSPQWHMIGHLQRNKVRALLPWVTMIHSIDSLRLAEEIDAEASKIGRKIPVLLQVNASEESTKQGVAVAAATHLVEQLRTLECLDVRGLMAMGPLEGDESTVRNCFHRVRELYDEIASQGVCGPGFTEMSIGMSRDFEIAIEVGATYLRIGSALFEGIELRAHAAIAEMD